MGYMQHAGLLSQQQISEWNECQRQRDWLRSDFSRGRSRKQRRRTADQRIRLQSGGSGGRRNRAVFRALTSCSCELGRQTVSDVTVGILSPSPETSELLRIQIHATGLAAVKSEVDEYCISTGDRSTRRFLEGAPNIIIVDMHEEGQSLQSIGILHSALPDTWLFASSDNSDAQVIIESMRAGAREFLPKPITNQALQQAIHRYIADRQKQSESKRAGKMYCVTAAKCGAGVTSVAINTAVAVGSVPGVRAALLDLSNTFGDVAAFLNM